MTGFKKTIEKCKYKKRMNRSEFYRVMNPIRIITYCTYLKIND